MFAKVIKELQEQSSGLNIPNVGHEISDQVS